MAAPSTMILASDDQGRHLCAAFTRDHALGVVRLGTTAPELPRSSDPWFVPVPSTYDLHLCGRPAGARSKAARALRDVIEPLDAGQLARWVRDRRRAATGPADLFDTLHALRLGGRRYQHEEASRHVEWLVATMPEHPETLLLCATDASDHGRWKDAFERASAVDPVALDPGLRRHRHHLVAYTAARAGLSRPAREALALAALEDGTCDLSPLADILGAARRPPADDASAAVRLAHLVHAADARLAADDAAGAAALLDTPIVDVAREVQSLARLAEASLRMEPASAAERFRRLAALGRFLDAAIALPSIAVRELPLGDAQWTIERLSDLRDRAAACLRA